MPKPKVTLRVSEIYAWKRRGTSAKRVFPNLIARVLRKDAECMAVLNGQTREELEPLAEGLRLLPQVARVDVEFRPLSRCYDLMVYSRPMLVTQRDRRDFTRQVRYHLARMLNAEISVRSFSCR